MYKALASYMTRRHLVIWRMLRESRVVDRVKLGLMVTSLVLCSGAAGSAVGASFLMEPRKHLKVNTSLFMQAVAPPETRTVVVGGPSTETTLAIDGVKLDQLTQQNSTSIDDRHTIHDQIAAIATVEVNHYNLLSDRLNVNDARVTSIGWVLGTLFTMSQGIVLFFHLDRRRQNTRTASSRRRRVGE